MNSRLMLRLIAPTLGVAALLLVLGGFAAWYVHQLQKESAQMLRISLDKVKAADALIINSHDLRHDLSEFVQLGDPDYLDEALRREQEAGQWVERCVQDAGSTDEHELAERIASGYERFHTNLMQVMAAADDDQKRELADQLSSGVGTAEVLEPVKAYRDLIDSDMQLVAQRDERLADSMGTGLLVLGVCGAVAGLVAGFGIARGIHRSIIQFSVPIHDAAGRLNEVVGPIHVSADTLGDLETTMQVLADRVGTVVDELQQSQAVAQRAEQLASLGQLAAGIAHELRNPLTSMKIIVQTACDPSGEANMDGRDLAILTEEITRLESTIQSFLDYARPPKPIKRSFEVREVLAQTIDFVVPRAEQMGIRFRREFPETLAPVDADASQLRQVFLNLLLNAIEASPENGTIGVSLAYTPSTDENHLIESHDAVRYMCIDVEDEGAGLPPDVGERIFEPFFSTKDSGTGLGLTICQRIIEDHGGRIAAANREQGGAVFSIWLPLATEETQPCPRS